MQKLGIFCLLLPLCLSKVLVTIPDGTNSINELFNAPDYSDFIGNKDDWNCSQDNLNVFFFGASEEFCDHSFPQIQGQIEDLGIDTGTSVVLMTEQVPSCPQEESYRNVERLGFAAFFNLREDLEGENMNVHNRGQRSGEGDIPFLELGLSFFRRTKQHRRDALKDNDFNTNLLISIQGCGDKSAFREPINVFQSIVFAFDGMCAFGVFFFAVVGYKKLRCHSGTLVLPRKMVLVSDGVVSLVLGVLLFSGTIRDRANNWLFDNKVPDDVKFLFVRQFAYFQLFNTFLAALYWDLLKRISLHKGKMPRGKWGFFTVQNNRWKILFALVLALFLELFEACRRLAYSLAEYEQLVLDVFMLAGIGFFAGKFFVSGRKFLKQTEHAAGMSSNMGLNKSKGHLKSVIKLSRHMSFWLQVYAFSFLLIVFFTILLVLFRDNLENNSESPYLRIVFYWGASLFSKPLALSRVMAMRGPKEEKRKRGGKVKVESSAGTVSLSKLNRGAVLDTSGTLGEDTFSFTNAKTKTFGSKEIEGENSI